MAKTNLTGTRLTTIRRSDASVGVQVAYEYTTSDGEQMSKTRDITEQLTAPQLANLTGDLTAVENKIKAVEGIA